jgi:hypothetical protein
MPGKTWADSNPVRSGSGVGLVVTVIHIQKMKRSSKSRGEFIGVILLYGGIV